MDSKPISATDREREDIRRAYEFVLGRDPESEDLFDTLAGAGLIRLLTIFFDGPEFGDVVRRPVGRHQPPQGGYFDRPPSAALRQWLQTAVPLEAGTRSRIAAAETWAGLYDAVFDDAGFREITTLGDRPWTPLERSALRGLAALPDGSAILGSIDGIEGRRVRGWAGDGRAPDRTLRLEFWIDDAFVGETAADLFRRDAQDRIGGHGRVGFVFDLPDDRRLKGGAELQVRDVASRWIVARAILPEHRPLLEPHQSVRAELAHVRAVLERLEAGLPALASLQGYPLEAYAEYYDAFYRPGRTQDRVRGLPAAPAGIDVVADAAGASPGAVEDFVWSIVRQSASVEALQLHGLEDGPALQDLRTRIDWSGRIARPARDWLGVSADLAGALARAARPIVLLVDRMGLLAPDAAYRFAEAMADPGVVAAYADEDRFDADAPAESARHSDPRFKSAFDPDLLSQTPYVGGCIAFRTASLTSPATDAWMEGRFAVPHALLRLGVSARVAHIPRLLWSAPANEPVSDEESAQAWGDVVANVFRDEPGVVIEPFSDDLGSRPRGAVRLRRVVTPGVSATVIIPTRDRLDLLRPCVESLWTAQPLNRTAMEIAVIDHQSAEPETKAWLADSAGRDGVRVDGFEGAFSWALMNNLAAARSHADVLVFLNNDTVVLSRAWLDALVGQAMRPEVGVVGARLLYEDGTLQHGGFVARDRADRYLSHDGVGLSGADGGYLDRYSLARRSVAVTGACLAVRRDVFQALGGFDAARLAVEGNDVDLCLKAQAAGLRVVYEPQATLYHLESKSRGFAHAGRARAVSLEAGRIVWERWSGQGWGDADYNPHFDRETRPFTRLRPPVVGWPEPLAAP